MIRNSGSNRSRMRGRIVVLVCVLSAFLVASGAVGLAWAEGDVSNGNGNVFQEMGQTEENANANEPGGSDKNAGTDSSQDENANSSANGGADSANDNSNESDSETSAQAKANAPMAEDEEGSGAATVNGTSYGTVQEAINVAEDGETVTVNRNFGEQLTITKNITLDLGGHTYTYTGSGNGITFENAEASASSHTEITNGTISNSSATVIKASNLIDLVSVKFQNNHPEDTIISAIDININNCIFNNNGGEKTKSIIVGRNIEIIDTSITNNTVTQNTVYSQHDAPSAYPSQDEIDSLNRTKTALTNSVIKNNTCTGSGSTCSGGIYSSYWTTTLNHSAIYSNTNTSDGNVDFAFWDGLSPSVPSSWISTYNLNQYCHIDLKSMSDPTDMSQDFSNSAITSKGKVREGASDRHEAEINGREYGTFVDAWREANDGDTITLTATNDAGEPIDQILADTKDWRGWLMNYNNRNITIDLNGRNVVNGYNNVGVNIWGSGKVTFINTSDKKSSIYASIGLYDNTTTVIGNNVEAKWEICLYHGNVELDGNHDNIAFRAYPTYDTKNHTVRLSNGSIIFGNDFHFTGNGLDDGYKFQYRLCDADDDEHGHFTIDHVLNDKSVEIRDINLGRGLSKEEAGKILLLGDPNKITNPLVSVEFSDGVASVHKAEGAIVYLDGDKGNDSNDGSSRDKAVHTFGRARQLVDEQLYPMSSPVKSVSNLLGKIFGGTPADADEPKRGYIIVCGTATISGVDGNATWCPSDSHPDVELTMLRDPDFGGPLVYVGGGESLTLKDITLDGNRGNAHATSSLVSVSGGTLTIDNGAILCNNELTSHAYMQANGGAVHAESSTINVYGGKVNNNAACMGGGIYGSNSIINIDGGQISDNQAVNDDNIQALGGGVMAWYGTKVNMTGGIVSNNHSDLHGGGIAIGCTYSVDYNKAHDSLAMTGGSVSDNVAEGSGGGIAIWSGTYDNYATASISGGSITGNKATSTRNGNYFAGGGVYVDGWGDGDKSNSGALLHDGELTLKNALVTSNNAAWHGGGFAGCPTSSTAIDSSAAIVGNTADGGNDFYVRAGINNSGYDMNGSPSYSIAARMFNGSLYNWVDDSGNAVSANDLSGQLTGDASLSLTSKAKVPSTPQNGVTISGNSSGTNGGGIGSNGTVTVEGTGKTYLTIKKIWEGQNPPDNLTIHVELGGIKDSMRADLKPITLTRENGWSADVEIPEKASGFDVAKVRVQEDSPEGWDLSGTSVAEDTGDDLEADDDDGWYTLNWDRDYADNDIRIGQTWTLSNVAVKPVSIDPPVKKVAKGDVGGEYPDFRYEMKPIGGKSEDGSDIALGDIPMPDGAEPDGDGVPSVVRAIASADLKVGVTGSSDDTVATASTELGIITFTRPGTYRYKVRELNDSKKGWAYDETVYTLEVNVTKDSDSHSLVAKEKSGIAIQKDATDNVMTFTNTYTKAEEPQNPGGGEHNDQPNPPAAPQGSSPEPTPAPSSLIAALLAQTGDSNPVALTAGIAVAGAALVAAALWVRRRNRGNHCKR